MRRFEPTPDQRRTVKTMAGFGIQHTDIAPFIGIDTKTLRNHCRHGRVLAARKLGLNDRRMC